MNFGIRYLTEYRYDGPVTDNLNALRVRPATTATQRVDDFHVRVDPEGRLQRHLDYFGTEVIEFGVAIDELLGAARGATPLATAQALCDLIPDRFAYQRGATYVGSTTQDLIDAGAGVCQDFVHLALILLRRTGIAARYVSGYFWAAPEDDGDASVEVETHAWVEALLPCDDGRSEPVWVGLDPTNRRLAGETHVKIGHGRHYPDVPPIKGVYRGMAASTLDARVTMTLLDPQASARA